MNLDIKQISGLDPSDHLSNWL